MARPRQFDEADVKAALRNVFWEHGYEGASYADIMAATGLNKGSLYASFGDKRALYQHAIREYDSNYVTPGVNMLRNESLSPKDRIQSLFDDVIAAAETVNGRWGCLLCNAAIDQSPFDEAVEKIVIKSLSRIHEAIKECVSGTPAESKAELIWTAYFGARVAVKAGYPKMIFQTQCAQVLSLFDG